MIVGICGLLSVSSARLAIAASGFNIGDFTLTTSDHTYFNVTNANGSGVPITGDPQDTVSASSAVYDANDVELNGYPKPATFSWQHIGPSPDIIYLPVDQIDLSGVSAVNKPCSLLVTVYGNKINKTAGPTCGPFQCVCNPTHAAGCDIRTYFKMVPISSANTLHCHCGPAVPDNASGADHFKVPIKVTTGRPATDANRLKIYDGAYYTGADKQRYAIRGFPRSGMNNKQPRPLSSGAGGYSFDCPIYCVDTNGGAR